MGFKAEYNKLNPNQKRAVDTIEGPVLVIAGPGTGKTQLLSLRVANILRLTDTTPSGILCLTFTESGQKSMQERLTNIIGTGAYEITIATYHSFGSDLIHRFPEFSDIAYGQRPIDDLLQDQILRAVLESLPYANPFRNPAVFLEDLKTFISDAKRNLLGVKEIRQLADENLDFLNKAQPLVNSELANVSKVTRQATASFASLCSTLKSFANLPSKVPGASYFGQLVYDSLQKALDEAAVDGTTKAITKWKDTWLIRDQANNFMLNGVRINQRLKAVAEIFEAYAQALDQRGVFDYDDMILRAIRLLEANDELRFTLQEQYQYILLDEFQDTNKVQMRLIELLTNNPVSEGRPNVMAVGDDDQAIYAFQGASYSNMLEFMNLYKDTVVVPLVDNYRSHGDILYVAQNITRQIQERLHRSMAGIQKELVAANKKLGAKAQIERHELPSDVAELTWVTTEIARLIQSGQKPGQIAVLSPKHRYLEPLVPFLRAKNIPLHYEKRENILDDRVIKELVAMARLTQALAVNNNTLADELWPQMLSFAFWNLPTDLIWNISWQAYDSGHPWQAAVMKKNALRHIGLFFTKLAYDSHRFSLEQILDSLIGFSIVEINDTRLKSYASPLFDYYFGKNARVDDTLNFWQTLSNLTVLRERLREYKADQDSALGLNDFLEFIEAHHKAGIKILSTTPFNEQQNAVQIMTAYKAKGLEFDTVFILGCQDEIWGSKARGSNSVLSLPKNLQHIRYAGMTEDEKLRLFFVAITRARHHLYLTSHLANYAGRTSTRLKYLLESVGHDGSAISNALPEAYRIIRRSNPTVLDAAADLEHFWHARHIHDNQQPALRALLTQRLNSLRLSPSHLNTFLDVIYAGPEALFLKSILRFPSAKSLDGEYGDAIHQTIEWLHRQLVVKGKLPTPSATIGIFAKLIGQKRLLEHDRELLIERGFAALTSYLKLRSNYFNKDDRHEVKLKASLGHIFLSGKIDKIIIDKQNKELTIVDFKTGKSFATWKNNEPKLLAYKRQLYFYKLLLQFSPEYRHYKVNGGRLEFIEPDEEGSVHTLTLNFETEEEKRLIKLIKIVWDKLRSLDFPDISAYPPNIKGLKAFEQDLLERKS